MMEQACFILHQDIQRSTGNYFTNKGNKVELTRFLLHQHFKKVDIYALCPKSPSVRGFFASLPVHLLV